ncbi:MAG: acetate--CoA ligase family protein [Halieaceae bacterium]
MSTQRLQALVAPASVAVVGATTRAGAVGNEVLVNLLKGDFPGVLTAVNPGHDEILGVPCVPSLAELAEPPEHVIFALGDRHIEAALGEAIALGIPAATIYSSLELDAAPGLKERIAALAKDAGMLLAGANGMGIYNFRERFWGCGFDTRDHPQPGNVVLLSQSGSGMSGILDCEQRIDFLFAASTGQELVVGVEDYLEYVLELPETRVIGLFLETSRQPQKLLACFARARDQQIPIVVLKVGKTELAAELAISHSGALAGSDASYQAVFDRYGVQRVADMDELATALILFAQPHGLPAGGLVSLHDSGGERQLMIDLAEQQGVGFADLGSATLQKLEDLLDPGLPAVNPLDAWGAGGSDADEIMSECLATMLSDENAALGVVVHDRAPFGRIYQNYIAYMERAHERSGKPLCLVSSRQGIGDDDLVVETTRRGFPVLDGVAQFLAAARCLFAYRDFLSLPAMQPPVLSPTIVATVASQLAQSGISGSLGEYLSSALLGECGLNLNDMLLLHSEEELEQYAEALHYPVVLKTAEDGIDHKSDREGVVLGIKNQQSLREAYQQLSLSLGPRALLAPMIEGDGVEMILGVSRDEQFGPMLVLGFGGVHAEVLQDVAVLMPPFDAACARRALDKLRLRPLLDGVRGEAAVDIDSFCEMAARLSAIAVAFADDIVEIDINPVKLGAWGAVGLDALVVYQPQTREHAA